MCFQCVGPCENKLDLLRKAKEEERQPDRITEGTEDENALQREGAIGTGLNDICVRLISLSPH